MNILRIDVTTGLNLLILHYVYILMSPGSLCVSMGATLCLNGWTWRPSLEFMFF